MKNYVFFFETSEPLHGGQTFLLDLAAYFADHSQENVYYVNNPFNQDIMRNSSDRLKICTPQNFDYSISNETVFICPVNYLMHLLVRIKDYPDAKICLYQYDAKAIDWLCAHLQNEDAVSDIQKFLDSFSSRSFLSPNCVMSQDIQDQEQDQITDRVFLPFALPGETADFEPRDLISKEEINIGYFGDMNTLCYTALYNIFNNFPQTDKIVNIHIIGRSKIALNSAFKQCSQNFTRIFYTGALSDEDYKKYIRENVDIVFANNSFAIEAATYGVPVVLPLMEAKPFNENKFTYLYDTNYYAYSYDNAALSYLNNTHYELQKIIQDVYELNQKQIIAQKCYDYCYENNSLDDILKRFLDWSESSRLCVRDCINQNTLAVSLKKFNKYANGRVDASFSDYLKNAVARHGALKLKNRGNVLRFVKRVAKRILFNDNKKFYKVQKHYKYVEDFLQKKYKEGGRIKVAFLVVFNSVFPTRPIFEKMLEDPVFDPYIIVVPNVSGTMKYQLETSSEAFNALSEQYPGRVIDGYDEKSDTYLELGNEYEIVFFCNPYKNMVHPYHYIEYFLDKNVLTVYSSYGFAALKFWEEVIGTDFYNYLWRACVETPSNLKHLQKVERIKGKNGVVTGYIKVDGLAKLSPTPRERKRILICPHHTVWGWATLNIGNFLKYSELFVKLPKMFPDVDFVFRPHPLLITNLKDHKVWTQSQIDEYFERLLSSPNMTYDKSGDYFQQFVDSDAMIHDCGSFIGEYLYTEKPCCYMMKSKEETYSGLVPLGQQCMDQYYHAFNEDDIIDFIRNVVVEGNDPMQQQRKEFVQTELKSDYPHAADKTIQVIKDALRIKCGEL